MSEAESRLLSSLIWIAAGLIVVGFVMFGFWVGNMPEFVRPGGDLRVARGGLLALVPAVAALAASIVRVRCRVTAPAIVVVIAAAGSCLLFGSLFVAVATGFAAN